MCQNHCENVSIWEKKVLNDRPGSLFLEDSPMELHFIANQEKARRKDMKDSIVNYQPNEKYFLDRKSSGKERRKGHL